MDQHWREGTARAALSQIATGASTIVTFNELRSQCIALFRRR